MVVGPAVATSSPSRDVVALVDRFAAKFHRMPAMSLEEAAEVPERITASATGVDGCCCRDIAAVVLEGAGVPAEVGPRAACSCATRDEDINHRKQ